MTALLVMDMQRSIVERFGGSGAVVDRAAAAIAAARAAGIPVVYVRVAFRPGYPEVSARNKSFGALRDTGMLADEEQTAITPRWRRSPATSSSRNGA